MEKIVHPIDCVMQYGCPKHIATSSSTNNYYVAIASSRGSSTFNDDNVNKNKQKKSSSSKAQSSVPMSKWKLSSTTKDELNVKISTKMKLIFNSSNNLLFICENRTTNKHYLHAFDVSCRNLSLNE